MGVAIGDGFDEDVAVNEARDAVVAFAGPGRRAAAAALVHWRRFDELSDGQRRAVLVRIPEWTVNPRAAISPARFLVKAVDLLRGEGIPVSAAGLDRAAFAAAAQLLAELVGPVRR